MAARVLPAALCAGATLSSVAAEPVLAQADSRAGRPVAAAVPGSTREPWPSRPLARRGGLWNGTGAGLPLLGVQTEPTDGSPGPPGGPGFLEAETQSDGGFEPGLALAASAVLPGAGQYLLGNDRWVPYLALELWGWVSFLDRRRDGRALAGEYRDLAWSVARRVSVGERRDTVFEYYEELTHFAASGTWDSDPQAAGVQPELDRTTFNGDLWALARSLFFPGGGNFQPGSTPYERALAYYLENAIPPAFTWAWGDSFLEQQSFRELIRRSDEAYRSSSQILGLILANHVVSAVDALVIGRLRGSGPDEMRRLRIGSRLERSARNGPVLRIEASWRW